MKKDKLKPVVTLAVYYGEKSWDGPLALADMMDIPEAFQPFINHYGIQLFQVSSAGTYQFQNQDNRDFFTLIEEFYHNDGKINLDSFKKKYPNLDIYWETLAALGAATGSMELVEYAMEHEGGKIHMCTALENLKEEGLREGRQEGRQEGLKKGILAVIDIYREIGYTDDMIIAKLKEKKNLNLDD